jgi:hypothetical protein
VLSLFGPEQSGHPASETRQPEPSLGPIESKVLHEQLEYLIDHADTCKDGCSVCRRFIVVRDVMMRLWR